MSAPSWFFTGLLAGAATMLGIVLLWRAAREATLRSPRALLAGGLTAAAIAAVAAGMSLAINASLAPAAASDEPAMTGSPAAMPPTGAMPSSSAMPPASVMSRILARPGSAHTPMAEPMEQAAADLAARLERQGGTAADWNLLAQAYDFLGRPADAQRARARAARAGVTPAAR